VVDFSSSLYLGFQHGIGSLRPWSQLTTGAPASLISPPGSVEVADGIARLQGCERGTLATSTLHLFWDLFGILSERRIAIYLDAGSYPIARWGVERAAARGVPVRCFPHRDTQALWQLLNQGSRRLMPVVVSDGICAACGCLAPIAGYLDRVRRTGGLLVIDDTQALGVLGERPKHDMPYGRGGGGSLRYYGIEGSDVMVVSSLAKGFGAPLAVLSGSENTVRQFEARSQTRVHCSPPSSANIHAGTRALEVNSEHGDIIRRQLVQRIKQFRDRVAEVGIRTVGGLFPIQSLKLPVRMDARRLYQQLSDLGLQTVLRRGHQGSPQISFIITAQHHANDIDQAARTLKAAVKSQLRLQPTGG
jgi:8-amino-7-oxononanoate synthase